MYNMYATGRSSNVHFLAARGSLSSGKPFVGKAFPTKKIGASAASNVAQGSCAHQTTKLLLTFPSMHTWWLRIEGPSPGVYRCEISGTH